MTGQTCYACDKPATGVREHHDHDYPKPACDRHRTGPDLCIYCDTPVNARSLHLDENPDGCWEYAHKKCHKEACAN